MWTADPGRDSRRKRGELMAGQIYATRHRQVTAKAAEGASPTGERLKTDEDLKAEIDTLLDEIDEVLEENTVEFLQSYRQMSGE
jgi:Pup-like protein.